MIGNREPENEDRLRQNRADVLKRLAPVNELPEGIIYEKRSDRHDIFVVKTEDSHLHLVFDDPASPEIMSRLDPQDPFSLIAPYTQAFMLALLWVDNPQRVYVGGFGGGRIPMLLHHFFPEVIIESTEIDEDVVAIAQQYFGIKLDQRLQVFIEDSREYLANRPCNDLYEIIMIDVFHGHGYSPYSLSTADFLALCKSHLSPDGILVFNLLESDRLYSEKIKTIRAGFDTVCHYKAEGAHVLFGTNLPKLDMAFLHNKAQQLQEEYGFNFPFANLANRLRYNIEFKRRERSKKVKLLTDANPPVGYFESLSQESPAIANQGRNDPCYCGSGKKFRNCHGRFLR